MKKEKPLSPVERLVQSLESRIQTYTKNKTRLEEEYKNAIDKQNQKITDCQLQLKALKRG